MSKKSRHEKVVLSHMGPDPHADAQLTQEQADLLSELFQEFNDKNEALFLPRDNTNAVHEDRHRTVGGVRPKPLGQGLKKLVEQASELGVTLSFSMAYAKWCVRHKYFTRKWGYPRRELEFVKRCTAKQRLEQSMREAKTASWLRHANKGRMSQEGEVDEKKSTMLSSSQALSIRADDQGGEDESSSTDMPDQAVSIVAGNVRSSFDQRTQSKAPVKAVASRSILEDTESVAGERDTDSKSETVLEGKTYPHHSKYFNSFPPTESSKLLALGGNWCKIIIGGEGNPQKIPVAFLFVNRIDVGNDAMLPTYVQDNVGYFHGNQLTLNPTLAKDVQVQVAKGAAMDMKDCIVTEDGELISSFGKAVSTLGGRAAYYWSELAHPLSQDEQFWISGRLEGPAAGAAKTSNAKGSKPSIAKPVTKKAAVNAKENTTLARSKTPQKDRARTTIATRSTYKRKSRDHDESDSE